MVLLHSLTWLALIFLIVLFLWSKLRNQPPGWQGNIFNVGAEPHGDVLLLKLGNLNTLVIQSATTAAEVFKNK